MLINISALAKIVRQLDVSATARSFVAVLAPFVVIWNIAKLYEMIKLEFQTGFASSLRLSEVVAFNSIVAIAAFFPLWFIVTDWMDRKQSLRHLSAVTGAALGAISFIVIGTILGFVLRQIEPHLKSDEAAPLGLPAQTFVVASILYPLCLLGLWLFARSKPARAVLFSGSGLLIVAGFVAFVKLVTQDSQSKFLYGLLLAGVPLLVWLLVRAIRIRVVISEDRPRALLFGEIHRRGFWGRVASLAGLPSSLWNAPALATITFWVFVIARPLLYVGVALLKQDSFVFGCLLVLGGHGMFYAGKRLAARSIWNPRQRNETRPPVLFLRSFQDDQFDFRRPRWDLIGRWFDLWSFRRNADEALIDEVAQYGPVVALGRLGESTAPFGAMRHYSSNEDWQATIRDTACRSQAIVIAAGNSPSVLWEYDLLRKENLLNRTLVLFHPGTGLESENVRALDTFLQVPATGAQFQMPKDECLVALLSTSGGPALLTASKPTSAAYVVALRAHFLRSEAKELQGAMTPADSTPTAVVPTPGSAHRSWAWKQVAAGVVAIAAVGVGFVMFNDATRQGQERAEVARAKAQEKRIAAEKRAREAEKQVATERVARERTEQRSESLQRQAAQERQAREPAASAEAGREQRGDPRSTGAQVDDETIELKLQRNETVLRDNIHLNVTSYNGVVLLTGEAPTIKIVDDITQLAKTTDHVRSVQNAIIVGAVSDLNSRSNDTVIKSKVKARLVEADKFPANVVKVVTERSVVYLMGIVSRQEGDAAAQIAARTSGVARVVKVFEYTH